MTVILKSSCPPMPVPTSAVVANLHRAEQRPGADQRLRHLQRDRGSGYPGGDVVARNRVEAGVDVEKLGDVVLPEDLYRLDQRRAAGIGQSRQRVSLVVLDQDPAVHLD